jgi:hypothetical protein
MTITKEIPVETIRLLGLQAGDSLHVLEERDGNFVLQISHAPPVGIPIPARTSAGAWARAARGTALLVDGGSRDDARMEYYHQKYGISSDAVK